MNTLPWLQPLQQQLGQLAIRGQLHHALLFTGINGVGKHYLAAQLAKQLLCLQPLPAEACGYCKSCLLVQAGHHPDLLQLSGEQSIGVDAVRELSHFMQHAPQQGGARVVLMPAAERMTEAASNALLKTLEEPGQNSFLLLQTAQPQQLLATILSRCQQWFIPAVAAADSRAWLQQQHSAPITAGVLDFIQHYAAGSPLRSLSLLQSGRAERLLQLVAQLQSYLEQQQGLAELVKQLDAEPEAPLLMHWVIQQQLTTQPLHSQRLQLFQRLAQWNRDEQLILGQNKTLSYTALLLELPRLLA